MEEKKSSKIKRTRALKNNFFACGLLMRLCPKLVVHEGVSRFLGYFEWLFYSAFFMRYVINSLETGESFGRILTFIIIVVIVFSSMSLYDSILNGRVYPISRAVVNKGLYSKLFKKSRNVELECFENSDFYDKYTLAMEKADDRLIQTVEVVFGTVFGFIASICAFIFMFQVDKLSVLFILFPIIGNFVFNRKNSKLD